MQRRTDASMEPNSSSSFMTLPLQEPALYDGRISRDAFKVRLVTEGFVHDEWLIT